MRSVPVWKWILILFVLLGSAYYLYPSFVWYRLPAEIRNAADPKNERIEAIDAEIAEIRSATDTENLSRVEALELERQEIRDHLFELRRNAIPLGLDLAGGMHVVLEVEGATPEAEVVPEDAVEGESTLVDQALVVYEARINKLGLTEPIVEKQGTNRILIQIPGVKNPDEVLSILRATAKLEFRLCAPQEVMARTLDKILEQIPNLRERVGFNYPTAVVGERDIETMNRALELGKFDVPPDYEFYWGPPETKGDSQEKTQSLYLLEGGLPAMGGETLDTARVDFQQALVMQPVVALSFNNEGRSKFAQVTSANVGENLAIVLDGVVYSAPTIRDAIRGGNAVIEGSFSSTEARALAIVLEAGALKTSVRIVENRSIGPSLGQDSIQKGLRACLWGFAAVVVFMPLYYLLSGVFANIALLLNLFMLAAAMAMFHATLTLPGIAGVILTIGMSVDANVLVFERIREEIVARVDGLATAAIERGYGRALSAIVDSNITTLLTALVLIQFGTGPIKGFAITLTTGIVISLFTALFVTRVFQDWVTIGKKNDKISIGPARFLADINIDFLKFGPFMTILSAVLLVSGAFYTITHWESMKGIELTGGSTVRVKYENPVETEELRRELSEDLNLPNPTIVTIGAEKKEFIIRLKKGTEIPEQQVVKVIPASGNETERVGEGTVYTKEGETEVDLANFVAVGLDTLSPEQTVELIGMESFSPSFGQELARRGLWTVVFSWFFVLLYLAVRFQFVYGVAAVAALVHDVLVALGALGISSQFGVVRELNLSTIAALLTVIGYSVNDTIVIFDRIRENRRGSRESLRDIINKSINQSLSRTLITSGTTLLVVAVLFAVGGDVINDFAFVLLVGILVGTYSTIYVAGYLLYFWQGRKETIRTKK